MLGEIVNPNYLEMFQKVYILHDFLLAFCIVSGAFASPVQMYLWAGVELLLTVLLLKFRVFKDNIMYVRQILLEMLFLFLSCTMAIIAKFNINEITSSAILLFGSIAIICIEIVFMTIIYAQTILKTMRKRPKIHTEAENKTTIKDSTKMISPAARRPLKLKVLNHKILQPTTKTVSSPQGSSYNLPDGTPRTIQDSSPVASPSKFILPLMSTTRQTFPPPPPPLNNPIPQDPQPHSPLTADKPPSTQP